MAHLNPNDLEYCVVIYFYIFSTLSVPLSVSLAPLQGTPVPWCTVGFYFTNRSPCFTCSTRCRDWLWQRSTLVRRTWETLEVIKGV